MAAKLDGLLTEEQTKNIIQTLDYIDMQIANENNAKACECASIRHRVATESNISEHSLAEMVGALSYRIWSLETACSNAAKALIKSLESEDSKLFLKSDVRVTAGILAEYGAGKTPKFTE